MVIVIWYACVLLDYTARMCRLEIVALEVFESVCRLTVNGNGIGNGGFLAV